MNAETVCVEYKIFKTTNVSKRINKFHLCVAFDLFNNILPYINCIFEETNELKYQYRNKNRSLLSFLKRCKKVDNINKLIY